MFTSTETPLASGATWTSSSRVSNRDDSIVGSVFTDQAGTIYIEQSGDGGVTYDVQTSYTITASNGSGFKEDIVLPTWRVRFTNTAGSPQTVIRLYARSTAAGDS